MPRKTRIGVFAPVRDASSSLTSAHGILPPAVLDELIHALMSDNRMECHSGIDLRRAFIKTGRVYVDDICLSDLDLFFWFYVLPHDLHSYDLHILKTLSNHTRVIPDPYGVERGLDKFTAHTLLQQANIATPEFCLFRSDMVNEMEKLLDAWGCLLLKPTLGSFGHGISMIRSKQQLFDVVQYASSFQPGPIQIFCERFEPNDVSKWISTTIINGQLIYGYRKKTHKFVDGWKVYDPLCIGGEADYVDPAPVASLTLAAAKALGADIIGFDCIFSERLGKYLIVDENTIPGLYADCFMRAGKATWADYFIHMVRSHLEAPVRYSARH